MKINIFYPKNSISIKKSFEPLVCSLKQTNEVHEFILPFEGANPINNWRNILFVRSHRLTDGINHIAGDAHYCILGLIGAPSVLTIHDDYAMRKATHGWLGKMQKYIFWILLPIKYATKVICITESTKKNILRYYNTSKLQVITHHCLNEEFKYCPKDFNMDCPSILQCGADHHKNLDVLIRAIQGLKCKLIVLTKMYPEHCQLADDLGVDYINYYNISNKDVVDLYKSSDIVTFASSYEGFGMPIIEAQCTGRVLITTNKEPMNWVAGENGAIFINNPRDVNEYRNALIEAISNEERRNVKIQNGLRNVERFSLDKVLKQYTQIYTEAKMFK